MDLVSKGDIITTLDVARIAYKNYYSAKSFAEKVVFNKNLLKKKLIIEDLISEAEEDTNVLWQNIIFNSSKLAGPGFRNSWKETICHFGNHMPKKNCCWGRGNWSIFKWVSRCHNQIWDQKSI